MDPLAPYDKPPTIRGMRILGNHVMLRLRRQAKDAELTERLAAYAKPLGGCSAAFARRLEATRLRWLPDYDSALRVLAEPEVCQLCEADRLFRLAMTGMAKAYAEDKVFEKPLKDARSSYEIFDAMTTRVDLRRIDYVVKTAEAAALQPYGQCSNMQGQISASIRLLSHAYDLLGADRAIVEGPGKGNFRPQWWGRSRSCCPSLPTYERKVAVQSYAFGNLALAFCTSDKQRDIEKALKLMPRINRDFPRSADDLNGFRAAWLEGRLLVVKHYKGASDAQEKRNIRSKVKTRLKHAYTGFLRHSDASPADALAVLADICALPWNAGKTAEIVRAELQIEDVTIRPHLEKAAQALPKDTRQHLDQLKCVLPPPGTTSWPPEAVRIPEYLDAFRAVLAELSWPPMAAWRTLPLPARVWAD
jgi:hypothetical protein